MCVVPATWEAKVGRSLEPGRWRLQSAETVPPHFGLGNAVRPRVKKKKKKAHNLVRYFKQPSISPMHAAFPKH